MCLTEIRNIVTVLECLRYLALLITTKVAILFRREESEFIMFGWRHVLHNMSKAMCSVNLDFRNDVTQVWLEIKKKHLKIRIHVTLPLFYQGINSKMFS